MNKENKVRSDTWPDVYPKLNPEALQDLYDCCLNATGAYKAFRSFIDDLDIDIDIEKVLPGIVLCEDDLKKAIDKASKVEDGSRGYVQYERMSMTIKIKGQPCDNPNCHLSITTACEWCGRYDMGRAEGSAGD